VSNENAPVVLDLAPLPREQIGPFLLLGLEKDAGSDQVEANWAKRLIWARKSQFRLALEDVNWARETINHADQRLRADILSLNADTVDGTLRQIGKRFGSEEGGPIGWQPVDDEKTLDEAFALGDIPDPAEVRSTVVSPQMPIGLPAASGMLQSFVDAPLDPWTMKLIPEHHSEHVA
jgi:hypothetical protein